MRGGVRLHVQFIVSEKERNDVSGIFLASYRHDRVAPHLPVVETPSTVDGCEFKLRIPQEAGGSFIVSQSESVLYATGNAAACVVFGTERESSVKAILGIADSLIRLGRLVARGLGIAGFSRRSRVPSSRCSDFHVATTSGLFSLMQPSVFNVRLWSQSCGHISCPAPVHVFEDAPPSPT